MSTQQHIVDCLPPRDTRGRTYGASTLRGWVISLIVLVALVALGLTSCIVVLS